MMITHSDLPQLKIIDEEKQSAFQPDFGETDMLLKHTKGFNTANKSSHHSLMMSKSLLSIDYQNSQQNSNKRL